ncbi:hypothetical protein OFS07_00520 [Brachyspira hyodysenteriae]|nr:hypothetical protein [Brachyspira hyodysenteriae]MDA0064772.1 hypothetical protein [Brachyspira hyodysenteriae]
MNITKLIDNDELKKDIEEFTNKLKKQGCIHVIGIVPKIKKVYLFKVIKLQEIQL